MAVYDRITGRFVDFRITPKGEAAEAKLPFRVLLPYVLLALGCILPVLIIDQVFRAKGFYFLTLLNGSIYAIISGVIVIRHLRDNHIGFKRALAQIPAQLAVIPLLGVLVVSAFVLRAPESLLALSVGIGQDQMVRYEYVVSGAGLGNAGTVRYRWDSDFLRFRKSVQEE